jgi:hypothetical protein
MVFLTLAEKERRVKELLEQGKSTREIADEVHISFGVIGSVRRRLFGETEIQTKKDGERTLSTDTKVFKMFEEGKTPIEVTIQLDLKPDDVGRLYKQWWDLKGLDLLNRLYEEIKDEIFEFHAVYCQIKDEGLPAKKVIAAARCIEQLPFLESRLASIQNELQDNENKKQYQVNELCQLHSEKVAAEEELNSLAGLINSHKGEISNHIDHIERLERFIARLKNSQEYQTVRAIAERQVRDVLADNHSILVAAFLGVIKALAKEPDSKLLIIGTLTSPIYDARSGIPPQNYTQLLQAEVLKLAEQLQNQLLAKCVNKTISSTLDGICDKPSFSFDNQCGDRTHLYNRK